MSGFNASYMLIFSSENGSNRYEPCLHGTIGVLDYQIFDEFDEFLEIFSCYLMI